MKLTEQEIQIISLYRRMSNRQKIAALNATKELVPKPQSGGITGNK